MSRAIWMPGGGGGADLDAVTAAAGDVLAGKVIVDKDGEPLTGTMVDRGNWTGTVGMNGSVTIPAGKHGGGGKVTGPAVTQRGAWTGRIGANGKITIPEGYHDGKGYVDQNLETKGAATYTPGTSNQTIAANQWLTGMQTIKGDANLVPGNIMSGKSIFGVQGNQKAHAYVTGSVVSSGSRTMNGELYSVSISLGFTPIVGFVMYYESGNRDVTIYSPNNKGPKPWDVINFNQTKRFGFNSWGDNNGKYGIVVGPNMVMPVSYGSVAYTYWFAGHY